VVENLLDSEDVRYMVQALRTLGYKIEEERAENRLVIEGSGGVFPIARDAERSTELVKLFLGNAGTAMRPLTAAVAAAGGNLRYFLKPSFL
jgi:3-phosphoshikimate 1-carboxyvinyltransferase